MYVGSLGKKIFFILSLALISCAGEKLSSEQLEEKKFAIHYGDAKQLDNWAQQTLRFKNDESLESYFNNILLRLGAAENEYTLRIVDDSKSKWVNFAIPKKSIYISSGLLKKLEFENELAAIFSIQIVSLQEKLLLKKITESTESRSKRKKWKALSFFKFGDDDNREIIRNAVKLLYNSGYDPRGVVSIWKIYKENLKHSPYEGQQLGDYVKSTFHIIAEYSPLRNPTIQSDEFILIRKRIEQL